MSEGRRLPSAREAVERIKQGILDDRILYLSDDELRKELAPYRASAASEQSFDAQVRLMAHGVVLSLRGDLDGDALAELQAQLATLMVAQPKVLTLDLTDLKSITRKGIQAFAQAGQLLNTDGEIVVIGATTAIKQAFEDEKLDTAVRFASSANARQTPE